MNASSERGIDECNKIKTFASTTSLYGGYKMLLLDEADNMTADAQKALRAMIEEFQSNCRFVLTANYPQVVGRCTLAFDRVCVLSLSLTLR